MFKPLNDNVVVLPSDPETKSPGGITLVVQDKSRTTEGVVVAVGPGRVLDSGARARPEIEPGQKIVFPLYIGTEVEKDGQTYRVMKEGEILAVYGPA